MNQKNISFFFYSLSAAIFMAKQKVNGQDIWPESSQTFGYVRARKRHIVHMDGFIERTKAESITGKI